ncbi:MAG: 50S ribosomal protein L18 [Cyanobacteria bacterium J06641_5]
MKGSRKSLTKKRHLRIRKKVSGTESRPRLAVFKSNQHIYAQVIDDNLQHTLASASTIDKDMTESLENSSRCEASAAVGKLVAQRALKLGVSKVVFDRGGNLYHGRVKALAEAAREAGLEM